MSEWAGAFQPEGETPFDSQSLGSKTTLSLSTTEMHLRKIGLPIFPLIKQNVKNNKSSFPQSEIDPSVYFTFETMELLYPSFFHHIVDIAQKH